MGATFTFSAYFVIDAVNTYWWVKRILAQATKKSGTSYLGEPRYWPAQGIIWGSGKVIRNNQVVKTFYHTFDIRGGFDAKFQGTWETWLEISLWFDLGGSNYQCYAEDIIEITLPNLGKITWTLEQDTLLEDASGGFERTKEYTIRVDLSTLPWV